MKRRTSDDNTWGGTCYEITFIDSGRTVIMTERECRKHFGKDEWKEYKAGYLPHVVVIEMTW